MQKLSPRIVNLSPCLNISWISILSEVHENSMHKDWKAQQKRVLYSLQVSVHIRNFLDHIAFPKNPQVEASSLEMEQ